MGPVRQLELTWHFKRDAVPPWIRLYTGRAARRRTLQAIEEEYALPPAECFGLIEESLQCPAYSALYPQSWNIPFLCAVKIPTPQPSSIWWWGGRDAALSNPVVRGQYHNKQARVFHGAAVFEVVQREWNGRDEFGNRINA